MKQLLNRLNVTKRLILINSYYFIPIDEIAFQTNLLALIAAASKEQNQGITQISSAVMEMDRVTQSNASGAEESASAAEELNAQAQCLRDSVAALVQLVGTADQAAPGSAAQKFYGTADPDSLTVAQQFTKPNPPAAPATPSPKSAKTLKKSPAQADASSAKGLDF